MRTQASVTAHPRRRSRPASPYERLTQAILTGEIAPGEPLVEAALSDWYKVSRTPVREALTRLEQDGLLQRTSRGLVVRERSPEEILDIYEIRIVLEATSARVAALRRTTLDLITLRRIADQLARVDTSDENEMASANREFHLAVWRASHNDSLVDLLSRLNLHLLRYPATTLSQPGRWEASLAEHAELIEAIDQQNPVRAADLATEHFTAARNLRLAIWADSQA
jgi:DNA-binding GntR family transcriptional regulator